MGALEVPIDLGKKFKELEDKAIKLASRRSQKLRKEEYPVNLGFQGIYNWVRFHTLLVVGITGIFYALIVGLFLRNDDGLVALLTLLALIIFLFCAYLNIATFLYPSTTYVNQIRCQKIVRLAKHPQHLNPLR